MIEGTVRLCRHSAACQAVCRAVCGETGGYCERYRAGSPSKQRGSIEGGRHSAREPLESLSGNELMIRWIVRVHYKLCDLI